MSICDEEGESRRESGRDWAMRGTVSKIGRCMLDKIILEIAGMGWFFATHPSRTAKKKKDVMFSFNPTE